MPDNSKTEDMAVAVFADGSRYTCPAVTCGEALSLAGSSNVDGKRKAMPEEYWKGSDKEGLNDFSLRQVTSYTWGSEVAAVMELYLVHTDCTVDIMRTARH